MDRELDKFRVLIILSGASLGIAVAMSYLAMPLSEEQINVLLQGGVGALAAPEISEFLWLAWLFFCVFAHALAFWFNWWSKPFFLVTFLLAIASSIVNGVTTHDPWSNTAWSCHTLFFAFTVGMLFFSPRVRARVRAGLTSSLPKELRGSPGATPADLPPDAP